jgi:hypothetical protein
MPVYKTTQAPKTYVIDYAEHLSNIDEVASKVAKAPPTLFHGASDMALIPHVGASNDRNRKEDLTPDNRAPWLVPATPDEAADRQELERGWVSAMREAGVDTVIPYICNQSIGGDPDTRSGLWWFYDRWDEYTDIAGPKPSADPIDWVQREPDGRPHFNYPYHFIQLSPPRRFASCPNNPYWHDWLRHVVRGLGRVGYDGVFIDNNILHCHCEHCQKGFQDYLASTYSRDQLLTRFGTDDTADLRLGVLGDKVLWASAQEKYLRGILEREKDEFVEKFGTEIIEEAIPSEAGNGFHWGRAHKYWLAELSEELDPDEMSRVLREGDVSSLGVETQAQLCIWADSQRFWAWSVSQRNKEIREAGAETRPGFFTVPNWGSMSGLRHTDSRRLDAKNVSLWKDGTDIVFFEEEYFPGTLAPGYTFDLLIQYKYSGSCGIRSCALPYRGLDHRALIELATAEAAAWSGDGMFVQPGHQFPEIRTAYRNFFESHADWYTNRTSVADVGLYFSFDELHLENMHHARETYPVARYLADQHVLFDFLCEGQLVRSELDRFSVVIVPHAQYLPMDSRQILEEYVRDGGSVLITGNTGAFDEHAHPISTVDAITHLRESVWTRGENGLDGSGPGRMVWIRDVADWLPTRYMQIHDIADLTFEELTEGALEKIEAAAATEERNDTRLVTVLDELAGKPLAVLSDDTPSTLRIAVWRRENESIVAHIVNYDAPGPGVPDGPVVPVDRTTLSLPIPSEVTVESVTWSDPWQKQEIALGFTQSSTTLSVDVVDVSSYRVIHIQLV